MEFKGTRGKWEYSYDGFEHCYDIVSDNEFICTTMSGNTKAKADALLISKAPEMLEMLKKCKIMCEHLNIHHVSNELNTLIKEATEL